MKRIFWILGAVVMLVSVPALVFLKSPAWLVTNGSYKNDNFYHGHDAACGGLYGATADISPKIMFRCREALMVVDGEAGGQTGGREVWVAHPHEAFCGYRVTQETPGNGASFQVLNSPSDNGMEYDGVASGKGAKVFMHVASRWIEIQESDPESIKSFSCTDSGWMIGTRVWHHGAAPSRQSGGRYCVTFTIREDESTAPGLGACPK